MGYPGRKRKIVERTPGGRARRFSAPDMRLKMRNAGILALQAETRICAVYIICQENGDRPVKIGISVQPDKRLRLLQVSNWSKLRIAKEIWLPSEAEAQVIEKITHQRLKSRGVGLSGEWFDLNAEAAALEITHTLTAIRENNY